MYPLIEACSKILDEKPLFFLINSYTTGLQASVLSNMMHLVLGKKFKIRSIQADELGIPVQNQPVVLPCGSTARCLFDRKADSL